MNDDYVGVKQIGTIVLWDAAQIILFPILVPLKQAETHT